MEVAVGLIVSLSVSLSHTHLYTHIHAHSHTLIDARAHTGAFLGMTVGDIYLKPNTCRQYSLTAHTHAHTHTHTHAKHTHTYTRN